MTDSVALFPPGFRFTDNATGAPLSGAVLSLYDATTLNPRTVFRDKGLTTAIGTSVTSDSLGRPTSDGSTPCQVYISAADYKYILKDSTGVTLETEDNCRGAIDTSSFGSGGGSSSVLFPITVISTNTTIVAADQNKNFLCNTTGGSIVVTLPSATALSNGWKIRLQHAGSGNLVTIASVSSQTLNEGVKNFSTQFILALPGESIELVADGGNWRVVAHEVPFMKKGSVVIPVVSRLASSPGSPTVGDIYIVTGLGGAWAAGFAIGDLALYTGGSSPWVSFTPPANSGWTAYVQAENLEYHYESTAWNVETATATLQGTLRLATQAEVEAETDSVSLTPSRGKWHPGMCKWWVDLLVTTNVPAVSASYNNSSITDTATGEVLCTINVDFSSANWCPVPSCVSGQSGITPVVVSAKFGTLAAGTVSLVCTGTGGTAQDPQNWTCSGFGDQ